VERGCTRRAGVGHGAPAPTAFIFKTIFDILSLAGIFTAQQKREDPAGRFIEIGRAGRLPASSMLVGQGSPCPSSLIGVGRGLADRRSVILMMSGINKGPSLWMICGGGWLF